MQHKKWSVLFSLAVGLLLTLFFVIPVIANVDTGWEWSDGGDGKPQRTLTYCIEGDDDDFGSDVDAATAAWNGEGLGWTLTQEENCENADVGVKQEDLGGVTEGKITLGNTMLNGNEGAWQGTAQGGTIRINNHSDANWGTPPTGRNRVRALMHEFGHAMRLDHAFGANDIMKQSTSSTLEGTAISDEDRREARTAANYTIGGTRVVGYVHPEAASSEVIIYPLPGAEAAMDLADTFHVWVEPFFDDMETEALPGWQKGAITVTVSNVNAMTIGSHAGITVVLNGTKPFHAEIPVTFAPLLPDSTPHADFVITPEVALVNTPIHLDAEASTHGVIDHGLSEGHARMTYRWKIVEQGGDQVWYTYDDYSTLFLPEGEYTVTLILEDRWGQVDEMSQPLTVRPHRVYIPLVLR
jgi:hypothetical protein